MQRDAAADYADKLYAELLAPPTAEQYWEAIQKAFRAGEAYGHGDATRIETNENIELIK